MHSSPTTGTTPRFRHPRRGVQPWSRRLLLPAVAVVLVTDLAGGLLDVAAGRSSLATAWSSSATLCAPWPMILFQVVAALVARGHGRPARVAALLLTLACTVSVLSGFLDGQLWRADLSVGERVFQVWLLTATGVLGVAAAARLGDRWTDRGGSDREYPVRSSPITPTRDAGQPET